MEGALNSEYIRLALGESGSLPSPEELYARLARAEIGLFLQQGLIDSELRATAWYLHSIGSARRSLELYPVDRQLRANQVAAHIFDLLIASADGSNLDLREMIFAAQIGYLLGDQDPNARALYRRRPIEVPRLIESPGEVALDIGSALLALDRSRLFGRSRELLEEFDLLRRSVNVADLIDTPYGSVARVVEGCYELTVYLTYGHMENLRRGQLLFEQAIDPPYARADLDSRWVASHLREIADGLGRSSVWANLPPGVPPSAARAMTLGDPPVLSLWPPQLDLLDSSPSPLSSEVKRLVLSFPTSGGKTLIAQYIVAAHIASGAGSVCVVVPTHSLGRELRRDLNNRLRTMGVFAADAGSIGLPLPSNSSPVLVMTPEKFAAHLRNEPERMLQEFTLFLIDEAHLVGDRERGWILESALSFLHSVTKETSHRIVLLSAALGNRIHVGTWLSVVEGEVARTFHSDWRGPRRAHVLFGTIPDWDSEVMTEIKGGKGSVRKSVPIHGSAHIRTGRNEHQSMRTKEPIGKLVLRRSNAQTAWQRDNAQSDPQYKIRARMATTLEPHGSVLVIEATKQGAQRTALAIASESDAEFPKAAPLVALATNRLGAQHPLITPLRYGVGFHHSALPADIQSELEDGIRNGSLRYLVATTTLIEGINFPVRSVLIGERGYRSGSDYIVTLDGPKLLNAIGRAGRAGRETEGWVVLAISEPFTQASFNALDVTDNQLSATSLLSTAEALDTLAEFETLVSLSQDAILEVTGNAVADFISHVWFVASGLEELDQVRLDAMGLSLKSTLAWQQLSNEDQGRWRAVAHLALNQYRVTPEHTRRRWSRTGMSLRSASDLESIASEVRASLSTIVNRESPVEAFRLIANGDRWSRILNVYKGKIKAFRARRNAPARESLDVDVRQLVTNWLAGMELDEIGQVHLSDVADETYRFEQLSEFVSGVLENFLPWAIGIVTTWVNEELDDDLRLCPDLAAYLRYGVDRPIALELARAGVRSRRLTQTVSKLADAHTTLSVKEWLGSMDVVTWRELFLASPSELSDLLDFARSTEAQLVSRALAGEQIEIELLVETVAPPGDVEISRVDEERPARTGVFRGHTLIGYFRPSVHDDIDMLLEIGVPLACFLTADQSVVISVVDPAARPPWFG